MGGNEALLVFKQDSISLVRGAANEQFVSAGVREGISEREGAISHRAVIWAQGDVYFLSQNGLRKIQRGFSTPIKLDSRGEGGQEFRLLEQTWASVNRGSWDSSLAAYLPGLEHVLFAVPTTSSALDTIIVYSIATQSLSTITGWTPTTMATVESTTGIEYVLFGDSTGQVYQYGDETVLSDVDTAIDRRLRSRDYWLHLPAIEKRMTAVDVHFEFDTNMNGLSMLPYADGVAGRQRFFSIDKPDDPTPYRRKYSRTFNVIGYGLAWEVRLETKAENMTVVRAATQGSLAHAAQLSGTS